MRVCWRRLGRCEIISRRDWVLSVLGCVLFVPTFQPTTMNQLRIRIMSPWEAARHPARGVSARSASTFRIWARMDVNGDGT